MPYKPDAHEQLVEEVFDLGNHFSNHAATIYAANIVSNPLTVVPRSEQQEALAMMGVLSLHIDPAHDLRSQVVSGTASILRIPRQASCFSEPEKLFSEVGQHVNEANVAIAPNPDRPGTKVNALSFRGSETDDGVTTLDELGQIKTSGRDIPGLRRMVNLYKDAANGQYSRADVDRDLKKIGAFIRYAGIMMYEVSSRVPVVIASQVRMLEVTSTVYPHTSNQVGREPRLYVPHNEYQRVELRGVGDYNFYYDQTKCGDRLIDATAMTESTLERVVQGLAQAKKDMLTGEGVATMSHQNQSLMDAAQSFSNLALELQRVAQSKQLKPQQ